MRKVGRRKLSDGRDVLSVGRDSVWATGQHVTNPPQSAYIVHPSRTTAAGCFVADSIADSAALHETLLSILDAGIQWLDG